MSRVPSVTTTTLLLVCAAALAMAIVVPYGSGELLAQQQDFNFKDFNNQARGEELSPAQVVFVLVFYGAIFVVAIGVQAFICFLNANALSAVPSQFRLMEPGYGLADVDPLLQYLVDFLCLRVGRQVLPELLPLGGAIRRGRLRGIDWSVVLHLRLPEHHSLRGRDCWNCIVRSHDYLAR